MSLDCQLDGQRLAVSVAVKGRRGATVAQHEVAYPEHQLAEVLAWRHQEFDHDAFPGVFLHMANDDAV